MYLAGLYPISLNADQPYTKTPLYLTQIAECAIEILTGPQFRARTVVNLEDGAGKRVQLYHCIPFDQPRK